MLNFARLALTYCALVFSIVGCGLRKATPALNGDSRVATNAAAASTELGKEMNLSALETGTLDKPDDLPGAATVSDSAKMKAWYSPHGTTMVGFYRCPFSGDTVYQSRADVAIDGRYPDYWSTYQEAWFLVRLRRYAPCYQFFSVQYVFF